MALSKSAVNRAGETLVVAYSQGDELPSEASEQVATWRTFHAEPLAWLAESVRRRTEAPVSSRLKRLHQIVMKLARADKMALARMQDIGGCRLLVETQADVDSALRAVESRAAPHYEVVRVTDYRRDGKQLTGYRAVHVILRRDELLVELQIRSRRQHGWAEAVERASNRTNHRLKDGEGPPELVNFFRVTSDCLAELDDGRRPAASQLREFHVGYRGLRTFLHDIPLQVSPIKIKAKHLHTRENSWLLIYNWRSGQAENWLDCGTNQKEAAETYSRYERRYSWRDGYEVVLIGSDSLDTIEWTHAHYFGRSADDLDPHGVLSELVDAA